MQLLVSQRAREDLVDIWRYTSSHWGEEHADLYIDLLVMRFSWLAQHKGLWRERADLGSGVYSYLEQSHAIYFLNSEGRMQIVRILHKSMDPALHLE